MAFSLKRLLRRSGGTPSRRRPAKRPPLRSEQLEPKLLLTRLFAVNTIDQLHEIDPVDGQVIKTLQLPLQDPAGEAAAYDGNDLWYATKTALYQLDPETADIREQWWLPRNAFRKGMAVTNGLIYMQNSGVFETLDVFDPETGSIIETLDLADNNAIEDIPNFVFDGMAGLNGMVVFTGTDLTNEEILFLDPSTGVIEDRFDIDLASVPAGLGVIGNEIHVGSVEDIVHVYDLDGTFLREYQLSVFFDNVVGFGADGVPNGLFHAGSKDNTETYHGVLAEIAPEIALANDHLPNYVEENWGFLSFTQPDEGSVSLDPNGSLVFDPELITNATTSFEYVAGQSLAALNASDGSLSDWYGASVAIDDNLSVVGAPLEDAGGTNSGAVYVNELGGNGIWSETVKLTASDATSNSQFGTAVAVSGSTIVVGAWLEDATGTNAGAAYVFDRDANGQWSQTAKLGASDASAGDHFGKTLAIHGDTIIVGAELDDPLGNASGAAYVFERDAGSNWEEVKRLVPIDGGALDRFGGDVAIDGDTIVVGAYRATNGPTRTGVAYVFERNQGGTGNWGESEKLTASDASTNDQFGFSLDVDGRQIAIAAPLAEFRGAPFRSNAGAVYVFEQGTNGDWTESAKITAESPGAGDRFGSAVAFDNGIILAGAPYADRVSSDNGAIYAFQKDGGSDFIQVRELFDAVGNTRDKMGKSIALSGGKAIAGTPHGDAAINNIGLAHVVDLAMSRGTIEVQVSTAGNVAPRPELLNFHINYASHAFREIDLVEWKGKHYDVTSWLENRDSYGELIEPSVVDIVIQRISE